jgi:hypothetical protein
MESREIMDGEFKLTLLWREIVRKGLRLRREPEPDAEGRWEGRLFDGSRLCEFSEDTSEKLDSARV